MPNAPRADAVVLRFSPMSAKGVLDRSALDARRSGGKRHYTASVWADHAKSDEETEAVIARLLAATELHGVAAHRNRHTIGGARPPRNYSTEALRSRKTSMTASPMSTIL
jgi:hypothetical protein